MTKRAWLYLGTVILAGAALSCAFAPDFLQATPDWWLFGILLALATAAQLLEAVHGRQSFYPHFIAFFAGVLLLHPFLFTLVVIVPHLVEWAKERWTKSGHLKAWYIQPFNIATHIIAGVIAHGIIGLAAVPETPVIFLPPFIVVIAVLLYVGVNHTLIGVALLMARRISLKDSGVFTTDSLLPDAVMACLGCVVAALWQVNLWWLILALSPLILMYKALMVPQLKQEARTDSKTGLLNPRHFGESFTAEFERARRLGRPLAFIMADLDLLRNINNTYGHLAGDAVLIGIAGIIRENMRADDIAGRFGGEEFAIVLPETDLRGAYALAERLRGAIEAAQFNVSTSPTPIQATMSLGVACLPRDADSQVELTHQADVAVYQAKAQGRNRVVCAVDVIESIKREYQIKEGPAAHQRDKEARAEGVSAASH